MGWSIPDTWTPYGDPASALWDAEEDGAYYEEGRRIRELRRERAEQAQTGAGKRSKRE